MCKLFVTFLTKICTSDIAPMPRAAFQSRPNRQLYNSPLTVMPPIFSSTNLFQYSTELYFSTETVKL